jgi:polyhydroxybutyrate depolymerase
LSRSYYLHIPDKYNASRPTPLIIDFHLLGMGFTGQSESMSSPYLAQADPEGVVMAFPTGSDSGPAGLAWNLGPCCVKDASVDDVAFTKAMIADIQKTVCLDPSRLYAVGNYTGGGMAYTLACRESRTFAAVAVTAWDLLERVDCNPDRAITVVSFRDPTDTFIPYGGGDSEVVKGMPITFMGAQKTFRTWGTKDGCTGNPTNDSNGCSSYPKCNDGAEVLLCSRSGTVTSPNDAAIAWQVLKSHSLPSQ